MTPKTTLETRWYMRDKIHPLLGRDQTITKKGNSDRVAIPF
jgi:hypothetical protein